LVGDSRHFTEELCLYVETNYLTTQP
jgi:hypothetical protein